MDTELAKMCGGRLEDPLQILRSGSTPAQVWVLEVS
jgi:hypothetical protein